MLNLFNFKETDYFRAFLLPSIVTGISAAIAIEYHYIIKIFKDKKEMDSLKYHISHAFKTFLVAFFTSFVAYSLIHFMTGFGNSMLHTYVSDKKFNV